LKLRIAMMFGLVTAAGFGAEPAGFAHWTSSELKGYEKKLSTKAAADPAKIGSEALGKFGTHNTQISHREASGVAEVHAKVADIFVVESGEATLVVGGEVVGLKAQTEDEGRGASIKGGKKVKLTAGDIVHIPAKMPHQLLLDGGKQFTYFVVKID
jgi:mannose-6-phosphate isomerase-like protein (cupin superfamily)